MDDRSLYRKGDTVILVKDLEITAPDGSGEVLAVAGQGSTMKIFLIESSHEIEWNATLVSENKDWDYFLFRAGIDDIRPTGETVEVLDKRRFVKGIVSDMMDEHRRTVRSGDLVPCSICRSMTGRYSNDTIDVDDEEIETVRFGSVCESCVEEIYRRMMTHGVKP